MCSVSHGWRPSTEANVDFLACYNMEHGKLSPSAIDNPAALFGPIPTAQDFLVSEVLLLWLLLSVARDLMRSCGYMVHVV